GISDRLSPAPIRKHPPGTHTNFVPVVGSVHTVPADGSAHAWDAGLGINDRIDMSIPKPAFILPPSAQARLIRSYASVCSKALSKGWRLGLPPLLLKEGESGWG
ncbi:MAG: hypothetical protein WCA45_00770, partial [Thiobacillaceae bacterium]